MKITTNYIDIDRDYAAWYRTKSIFAQRTRYYIRILQFRISSNESIKPCAHRSPTIYLQRVRSWCHRDHNYSVSIYVVSSILIDSPYFHKYSRPTSHSNGHIFKAERMLYRCYVPYRIWFKCLKFFFSCQ